MAGRKIDSPVRAFTEAPVKIDSPLLTCLDHPLMAGQAVLLLGGLSLRRSLFNKGEYFFSMVHNYLKLLDRNQNGSVHFWAENTDASWFDVEVALPFLNRFRFVSARHDSLFLLHEFSSGHAVWSCASIPKVKKLVREPKAPAKGDQHFIDILSRPIRQVPRWIGSQVRACSLVRPVTSREQYSTWLGTPRVTQNATVPCSAWLLMLPRAHST